MRELMHEAGLEAALAHVPGYVPGRCEGTVRRLSGGSVNRSYRVCTPAGGYVVRLSPVTDAWLAADRSVERELHARAAAAGIAPRIVHADGNDRWLITELVEGRLWSEADFGKPHSLGLLADTLSVVHALEPPAGAPIDLLGTIGAYARQLQPADPRLEGWLDAAARAWPLSGAPERQPAIVHHDLHASNLIETGAGLRLIDWECAAVADPLLDVACILSYYETAWSCAALLLERAGLRGIDASQLRASVWLFDLHTWLWYCERRQRLSPTQAELDAEQRLSARLMRGVA
ncbi:MAG TPA: phosphotransferase [Steroidobacteraceae bacterium]|nr:phosphotransferase [Steroidobacteraceae bacterium]